jgi:hypothetical protein
MAGADGFRGAASECPFRASPTLIGGVFASVTPAKSATQLAIDGYVCALIDSTNLRVIADAVQQRGPPQA